MGTDSKYLEEAMAELERSLGTFSNNEEITSLIVNNLDSQLKVQIDAYKIKKEIIEELNMEKIYLDFSRVQAIIQMLVDMSCKINLGIYHLCYYTDSYYAFYDSRAILFWFENYNVIWNIDTMDVKVEKEVNGCKVLVTNTINNNYKCDVVDTKSPRTCREVNEMNIQGGKTNVIALFNKRFERDNVFDDVYWTKLPNNEYWRINIEELFRKIWWLEQQIDDEFLYDNIVNAKTYMRYYKNNTCEFDLRYMSYVCKRTRNYVEREKQKDRLTIYEHKHNITKNKVTAKEIETGKKVYKYVVTYRSKPILVEDTGRYITLETGCYKWVEE